MRRLAPFFMSVALLICLCGTSLIEAQETVQSTITSLNPAGKQIGILIDAKTRSAALSGFVSKPVTMQVDDETKIIMGGKSVGLADLAVGDSVKVTFVEKKGLRGKSYLARHIEVLEHKTEGIGTVLFVEPGTSSIGVEMGGKTLVLCTSNVTQFQGVESLNDIKVNDKVFVEYFVCDDGKNTIKVLKKGDS